MKKLVLALGLLFAIGCGKEGGNDNDDKKSTPLPAPTEVEVVEDCAAACHEPREMPEEDTKMGLIDATEAHNLIYGE